MNDSLLFTPVQLGELTLRNRMVMAPMTRSRANDKGIQNPLAATYYGQRASAGLIVTEAISVSKQGSGYPLIPGLWNVAQAEALIPVVSAVHAKGGLILAQLFHTGRIGHSSLFGEQPVSASAIAPEGQVMTASFSMESFEAPRALESHEIPALVESFRNAAMNAKVAGFDGIEIHAANGYIIDQFLRDGSNHRTDAYGGSVDNRARLLLEIVEAVVSVFGAGRVGVRFSPASPFNSMSDSNPVEHFGRILELLEPYPLAFVHLIDPAAGGDQRLIQKLRSRYVGNLITNGGFDAQSANAELEAGWAEAIAFGVSFLANPDLPERLRTGAELNAPDPATFYQGGDKGYIDYPALAQTSV